MDKKIRVPLSRLSLVRAFPLHGSDAPGRSQHLHILCTTFAHEVLTPVLIATTLRDPQLSWPCISGRSHRKEISLTCGL